MENSTKFEGRQAKIAALREARRKKILENGEDRIGKITGRPPQENKAERLPVDEIYPDPELEPIPQFIPREFSREFSGNYGANAQTDDILHLLNSMRSQGENGMPPGRPWAGPEKPPPPGLFSRILRTKVHIALIAIGVYILFATGNENILGGNVFVSLLLWEMAEILILKTYQSRSTFALILFVIGRIPEQYTASAVKIFETIHKVLQDVAVFTFFFVLSHLGWHKFILGTDLNALGQENFERI
ncbi:uncharacterized protein LOC129788648 isoform X2 [Lutzomyia longipalpis]|uniref:uncharacterized protein LOC129788648 isoform X2 n=1 Tax=Lutzomyia longipalpis TaxID=7200 RepID=UPI002483B155|nr:uncharacterized protein LOC129788648 isoform X2 [Lutzomyia longipalpis]